VCRRDVIVAGPPGSGKSTLAARLAERLGAVHLDLGSRLRERAAEESARARARRAAMAAGELLPDAVPDRIVRDALAALPTEQGVALDGYPRTAAQARALERVRGELGRLQPRPVVVRLDVPRAELRRRLARRREAQGRADDADAAIAHRLERDAAAAGAVLDALAGWADVVRIDADGPVDAVIEQVLGPLRGER
jgi:adenylate kinase